MGRRRDPPLAARLEDDPDGPETDADAEAGDRAGEALRRLYEAPARAHRAEGRVLARSATAPAAEDPDG